VVAHRETPKTSRTRNLTPTSLGNVRLVGSTPSALHEEHQWSVPVTQLRLDVLGKHSPVEMIGAERPTDVERSAVAQHPAEKLHPLKI